MINKIFIIAGEKSGDNLGGKLITELLKLNNQLEIKFIGGNKMQAALAAKQEESPFSMQDINLMGFAEILPHAFKLIKRIGQTVTVIKKFKPDIVVTIDSPGFNFRVVKKLREYNGLKNTKFIHYVAPSVWAYKPERAKKTARLYNKLISIIPWEKPYFEAEGLDTKYFGHPIFEDIHLVQEHEVNELRDKYNISEGDKIISVLPGSRAGEIKKHTNILRDGLKELFQKNHNLKIFLLPTKEVRKFLEREVAGWKLRCNIIDDEQEKQKILQISGLAMVKSGTVALEVAAQNVPHFIFYKANPISAWFLRRIINIKFANLINISANKEIVPELLQENFTCKKVIEISQQIMNNTTYKSQMMQEMAVEIAKFKAENNPSKLTAIEILKK